MGTRALLYYTLKKNTRHTTLFQHLGLTLWRNNFRGKNGGLSQAVLMHLFGISRITIPHVITGPGQA